MSDNQKEITEQALVAILGAIKEYGADAETIAEHAKALTLDSSSNYQVHGDHTIISEACEAIDNALSKI